VAFGAENVQATERDYFIVFGFALARELIVDGFPLVGRNLENFALVLKSTMGVPVARRRRWPRRCQLPQGRPRRHGQFIFRKYSRVRNSGLPPSRMSVPRPAMLVATVTAPLRASLRDDARFALVLLCV